MVKNLNGKNCTNTLHHPKNDYVPVLIIALLTFLPLSGFGNLVRLGVAVVLFCLKLTKNPNISSELWPLFGGMIVGIGLPILTVLLMEHSLNMSTALHEIQRFAFYILLISVVFEYKVPFRFIYYICLGILLVNFAIQILQYNGVTEVNDFIRQYYLTSDNDTHLMLATYTESNFRSGSIYLNPNVYMVIPSVILGVILQANMLKHSLINYLWAAIALASLLLTGSRTTFFVAAAILVIYIFLDKQAGFVRWVLIAALVGFIMVNFTILQENFRVFEISEGVDSSFGIKFTGLLSYLKNTNPLYYITGSLSSSFSVPIDAEWGYIYEFFGIAGIYWYIKFINLLKRNHDRVPFLSITTRIVLCLIALTATIVLCMPVFTFFCVVGLVEVEV